ncbi:ABC-type nickel/cobalt efflux system, permease component RcnA [Cohaesibacter marisflavi]|uniref:Nickel/cobalt efflux system n=1 Tax=Cohaesibacter marisflavi TaxID=655353 RepID=A0A1I5HML4_9HYPH|nr:nickel/cobalt transporter [Cohaesibacter marisflavi]SFO49535.1 ABC-type nickel/cobalt efflux system, permease component RcnA [Cohaesibacter marisflavi]
MRLSLGPFRPSVGTLFAGFALVMLSAAFLWVAMPLAAHATPSPFGVALPDTTGPMATSGLWADIQRWILARQSDFYMALKDAVKLVRTSWPALFLLLGLSMAYGLFHAAGPGHGKVVLTTYLFASGASARKGAILALVAAMVQASVAVLLIGIAAVLLNLTSIVITQTAQLLELASYAMFVILGGWLILRAMRSASHEWGRLKGNEPAVAHHVDHHDHDHHHHHHHDHHHDEACGCGHSHAAPLEVIEQAKGVRGMALAVISMGLRPCSGALIVLVFALSQKVFWAGVLSAYAMGLGTGLTVAALALIAVYARSFSQVLANRGLPSKALDWFGVIILFLAGVIVLMFGGILLLANLL